MSAARARLMVVDDHPLLVDGMRAMLGATFDIVGTAASGDGLLRLLDVEVPDLVLLDLSMPERSGLDLLPELHRRYPALRVLVVTMHLDRVLADAAFASGAMGFIPKDCGAQELMTAINEVLAGHRYTSPRVPPNTHRVGMNARHLSMARLTPRQQEIVHMISEGRTTPDIADALDISVHTVSFHRKNIRRTLGISDEWGLIRFAILMSMSEVEAEQAAAALDGHAPPTTP